MSNFKVIFRILQSKKNLVIILYLIFVGSRDHSWDALKTTDGCPEGFNPAEFATQTCFLGRYGPEMGSDEFGGIIFIFAGANQPKNVETVIARFSNVELEHVGQSFKKGKP